MYIGTWNWVIIQYYFPVILRLTSGDIRKYWKITDVNIMQNTALIMNGL